MTLTHAREVPRELCRCVGSSEAKRVSGEPTRRRVGSPETHAETLARTRHGSRAPVPALMPAVPRQRLAERPAPCDLAANRLGQLSGLGQSRGHLQRQTALCGDFRFALVRAIAVAPTAIRRDAGEYAFVPHAVQKPAERNADGFVCEHSVERE